MGLSHDLRALLIQASAPFTVRYGEQHRRSGSDLPGPTRLRVPTRHGNVRCEVYQPSSSGTAALPAYVHFHGGAFLMRYPRMDDFFARIVAAEVGAVVVNVDYDVAPQRRFPVAHEQCHDVAAWIAQHPEATGTDGRTAIGGFSAGGNLAASVALQARDAGSFTPLMQLLGAASLDVAQDPREKQATRPDPMIGPELLALVRATYFRDVGARASSYASPLRAASLAGLPPALVITAEYDVLRAEGDAYARRLVEDGVEVRHQVVPGADHYFLENGPAGAARTLDLMVAELRRCLGLPGSPG